MREPLPSLVKIANEVNASVYQKDIVPCEQVGTYDVVDSLRHAGSTEQEQARRRVDELDQKVPLCRLEERLYDVGSVTAAHMYHSLELVLTPAFGSSSNYIYSVGRGSFSYLYTRHLVQKKEPTR